MEEAKIGDRIDTRNNLENIDVLEENVDFEDCPLCLLNFIWYFSGLSS